jgi:hypothetical protein
MTAVSWPSHLRTSPELFPIDLHPPSDAVALIPLSRVDYEKASFLDTRLELRPALTPAFAEVAQAAQGLPIACDYIFHIGHVGSTLLSRLLGTHARVFSLREPLALRTLAQADWPQDERERRLAVFAALYSRTWTPEQRALVKATSLVSEIAGALIGLSPASRALMMTVRPQTYLESILGGPNSRLELAQAAPARLARLNRRIGGDGWRLDELSEGERCAMSWACEMTALAAAAAAHPGRAIWIDFDTFLADPRTGLTRALSALHGEVAPEAVAALAGSAYFQRYSKAPEYAFGADVRAEVLAAARRDSGEEIARGLAWLDRAAGRAPIAAALNLAETADVA